MCRIYVLTCYSHVVKVELPDVVLLSTLTNGTPKVVRYVLYHGYPCEGEGTGVVVRGYHLNVPYVDHPME